MHLHRADRGRGPAVVLLHAFPLDSRMFDALVPLLTDEMRVVTIDLPGLGRSPVPDSDPSMDDVAAGVLSVMDELLIDRAVVLGISTGGYVALQMAERAPSRLAALVLGSTTPHRMEPDLPAERWAVAHTIEELHSTAPVADSADEGLGDTTRRERPDLVDSLERTIAGADPDGVAWMARAIAGRSDTTAVLRSFTGPVTLLFGAEDVATPPARGEEMLALRGRLPGRLVVVPRTGHLTPLEAPTPVADVVLELAESTR